MIDKISGKIVYWLYSNNKITEDDFEKYDYVIGTTLFGIVSTSSFILIGFILGHLTPMLISMACLWVSLQLLNKKDVHSRTMLGCSLITSIHLLLSMYGSLQLEIIFSFDKCLFVYSSLISITTVSLMVSERGIIIMRWIEDNIFFWDKN